MRKPQELTTIIAFVNRTGHVDLLAVPCPSCGAIKTHTDGSIAQHIVKRNLTADKIKWDWYTCPICGFDAGTYNIYHKTIAASAAIFGDDNNSFVDPV